MFDERTEHFCQSASNLDARKPDRGLLRLLARAHRFRDLILRGDGKSMAELAEENGVGRPYFSRIVRLGFLAPDITSAILDGRQPIDLSAKQLSVTAELAKEWSEQRRDLGFGDLAPGLSPFITRIRSGSGPFGTVLQTRSG